MVQKGAPLLVS